MGGTARRRCRRRRSRPSCSGSSSTRPPTSGSPSQRRSAATRRVWKALLAHPLVGQDAPAEQLLEHLLAQRWSHDRARRRRRELEDRPRARRSQRCRARLRARAAQLAAPHRARRLRRRAAASRRRESGSTDDAPSSAQVLLAGVDFPDEEHEAQRVLDARGWAGRTEIGNDTFAVLRAGTERGWGVAITCGAGINCVGVAPDGRRVRFPALGAISGDWGGGYDVGLAGLSAAARSEDGRGPTTCSSSSFLRTSASSHRWRSPGDPRRRAREPARHRARAGRPRRRGRRPRRGGDRRAARRRDRRTRPRRACCASPRSTARRGRVGGGLMRRRRRACWPDRAGAAARLRSTCFVAPSSRRSSARRCSRSTRSAPTTTPRARARDELASTVARGEQQVVA